MIKFVISFGSFLIKFFDIDNYFRDIKLKINSGIVERHILERYKTSRLLKLGNSYGNYSIYVSLRLRSFIFVNFFKNYGN